MHPKLTDRPGIAFTLNGRAVEVAEAPARLLLDTLRETFGLTAAKYGCGLAQCGACTVLVDGRPARACVLRMPHVAGREVVTLEGLADPETGALHPVQQGFLEAQGAQCGYCLNGMVMSAVALLADEPRPSAARVAEALRHNLCRCGTHTEIVASVLRAAELMGRGAEATPGSARAPGPAQEPTG
jgi:nicotinate dehydrogenase subunit A